MAIFFCAYSLDKNKSLVQLKECVVEIITKISPCSVVGADNYFSVSCDLGIWKTSSEVSKENKKIVIAGDPVIRNVDNLSSRASSINLIFSDFEINNLNILRSADGTYCGFFNDLENRSLLIFVDKLSVRPVYYSIQNGLLVASNCFWLIESIKQINKSPDLRGISEKAAFGFSLGDRTIYKEVSLLPMGAILKCSEDSFDIVNYWNWKEEVPETPLPASLAAVENCFTESILARLDGSTHEIAFLSGGMDSRLIAATLVFNGVDLDTINIAPKGSRDLEFGKLAASALSTFHFELTDGPSDFYQRQIISIKELNLFRQRKNRKSPRSDRLIWSGDGGSVGLGHVYLDHQIIDFSRNNDPESTAQLIIEKNKNILSKNIFKNSYGYISELPVQGVIDELMKYWSYEPGRACHIFYMFNDQRRHLVKHYENIHLSRMDYVLPFFDSKFIKHILSREIDQFINHSLYNQIFDRWQKPISDVPWQAYPGHVPCPINFSNELRDQWEDGWHQESQQVALRNMHFDNYKKFIKDRKKQPHVLSISKLFLAYKLSKLGIYDYTYMLDAAIEISNSFSKCTSSYIVE